MEDSDRAFVRWQSIRQNQLSYVNDILILLATGMFGFQIQFGFNSVVQISTFKLLFIISMGVFFVSIIVGVYVAWNRLISFRKTTEITRNREKINGETERQYSQEDKTNLESTNKKLRVETDRLDERTWFFLPLQALLFIFGGILLFVFTMLEMI